MNTGLKTTNALTLSEVEGLERGFLRTSKHLASSFDFAQDERRESAAQ